MSLIGRKLGPFQITGVLGEGSMGAVYRAVDERLEREVALKLLQPEWAREESTRLQFQHEARVLARLAHPNIATIHELVMSEAGWVLVMERVPGESLAARLERGALSERDLLGIFVQLADGLEAAHRQGVIHRDLKPGNVQITPEGQVKILDFGLATIVDPSQTSGALANLPGDRLAGTPAYLAPEVLAGAGASAASDLYAMGLLMHEAIVGSPVRTGSTVARVLDAIRSTDPLPPSACGARLSPALDALIMRCLERDPARRPASGADLAQALRALADRAAPLAKRSRALLRTSIVVLVLALTTLLATRRWHPEKGAKTGSIRAIAVLPFESLVSGSADEALDSGFTEELIGQLSQVSGLRVTSFTSVKRFIGTRRPLPDVAEELAVDALVEGSIRQEGKRVRAMVRLVSAAEDTPLWTHTYEGRSDRLMDLQLRMARAIVSAIRVRLSPQERARLRNAREPDPVAYAMLLRGRYHLDRRTPNDLMLAERDLEASVGHDPDHAPTHAALAAVWSSRGRSGLLPADSARSRALAEARRAVELDPDLSDAHTVLGGILHDFEWNWPEAEAEYRHAISLNPSDAMAHHHLGHLLAQRGQFDSARAECRLATRLAPATLPVVLSGSVIEYLARRQDTALMLLAGARELDSTSVQYLRTRAGVLLALRREPEAVDAMARSFEAVGQAPLAAGLRTQYASGGLASACEWLARMLIGARSAGAYVSAEHIAELLAQTPKHTEALDWLERAHDERDPELNRLGVDPIFDPLRGDPRFQSLLSRMRLPRIEPPRAR